MNAGESQGPGPSRRRARRGRPDDRKPGSRSAGSPTRTRLLALRVLERVERAGAYADLLLHGMLGRSSLNAADRAFATEHGFCSGTHIVLGLGDEYFLAAEAATTC